METGYTPKLFTLKLRSFDIYVVQRSTPVSILLLYNDSKTKTSILAKKCCFNEK